MILPERDFKQQVRDAKETKIKHTTSASSIKTYKSCQRKWWLTKVRKLPTRSSQANIIGTVAHSVCERYLLADDQGYDRETKKPVELYPEGWHIAVNTYQKHVPECRGHKDHPDYVPYTDVGCDCPHPVDGELTIPEQAMLKKLISQAIDAGVLERHPGREIEKEIRFTGLEDDKLGTMSVIGFIDVLEPDMIQDHKTTGRMKYALSKAKLFEDIQMNLYGYHSAFIKEGRDPDLEYMWLRHNVYCKDPSDMRVRKTEVEKPVARIKEFYDKEIAPCYREMMLLIRNTENFSDIAPPDNIASACNAYGGCPFMPLCSGGETMGMFIKRFDNQNGSGTKHTPNNGASTETEKMRLLDKQLAKAAKKQEAPAVEAPVTKAVPVTEVVDEAAGKPTAPWFVPQCKACSGNPVPGIGSNGQPCMVCVAKSKGKVDVDDYAQDVKEDGTICWTKKETGEVVVEDTTTADKEVIQEEKVGAEKEVIAEKKAQKQAVETKQAIQKEADDEAKEARAEVVKEKKKKPVADTPPLASTQILDIEAKQPSRRKKFLLVIGGTSADGTMSSSAQLGHASRSITLEELLLIVGEKVAEIYTETTGASSAISYWDINAFERRDFVAAQAFEIAMTLGSSTLVCGRNPTPDENILLSALRPLASRVFICNP